MPSKLLVTTLLVAAATANASNYNYGGSSGYGGGGYGGSSSWGVATATASAGSFVASQAGELIVQIVSVSDQNGSLKYFPDSVQAAPGSIVQFQYHPKNHTITESSFAAPCKPLAANLTTPTRPGLRSGFVPVTGTEAFTPVFNVLINDTKPIWIYCGQTNHCEKGMSMVINQNLSDTVHTIEKYQAAAALLPLVNTTTPPSTTSSVASVAVGTSTTSTESFSAAFGLSTTTAAAATSTSEVLSPPTETTAVAASSTAAVQPATFTGVASRQHAMGVTSLAGLLLGGVFAIW